MPGAAAGDPRRPALPRRRLLRPRRPGPRPGWASRAGSRTSPTAASSSCTSGSAASPQGGEDPLGGGGRYAVESYLDHHAGKLAGRFDANCYVVLTEAMNSHDVGRGRGGVAAALRRSPRELRVVGVDSDRLYPPRLSQEIADAVRGGRACTRSSTRDYGHDGFLIEIEQVGAVVARCCCGPA